MIPMTSRILIGAVASLVLGAALPVARSGDARTEFNELQREFHKEGEAFNKEYDKLQAKGDANELEEFEAAWNPVPAFLEAFAEKAAEYAGTEDAPRFLRWIVEHEPVTDGTLGPHAAAALGTLLAAHAESVEFESMLQALPYRLGLETCLAIVNPVVERAKDDKLRHRALLTRGAVRLWEGGEGERERARADFQTVRDAGLEGLSASATAFLFELERLQIGSSVPDIVAEDLDGVGFKLSDYRGKVVMLDFWGDW